MAVCDEGYLCQVCGAEVEDITDSDLYLRYVLGEVDPETLHQAPERHIRCNPVVAQFIVASDFPPVVVEGPFSKAELDEGFVREEEARITAGYLRLHELFRSSRERPITEYPLPGRGDRWRQRDPDTGTMTA